MSVTDYKVNTANCEMRDTCIHFRLNTQPHVNTSQYSCIPRPVASFALTPQLLHIHTLADRRAPPCGHGVRTRSRAAPLAIARHAASRAFKAQQAPCAPSNFEVLFIRLISVRIRVPRLRLSVACLYGATETSKVRLAVAGASEYKCK